MTHEPVLEREVVDILAQVPNGAAPRFVDCTLGGGGHAAALLEAVPEARLLGLDRDPEAVAWCAEALARFGGRVDLQQGDYRDLAHFIEKKTGRARSPASSPTSASRASSSPTSRAASRSPRPGPSTCGSIAERTRPPRPSCSAIFPSGSSRTCSAAWVTNRMRAALRAPSSRGGGAIR